MGGTASVPGTSERIKRGPEKRRRLSAKVGGKVFSDAIFVLKIVALFNFFDYDFIEYMRIQR